MREIFIAGNWKMNLDKGDAIELFEKLKSIRVPNGKRVLVAPPSIYLKDFVNGAAALSIAAQNCSQYTNGAYTGEVSASMLASLGVEYCIVGHSERRSYFGEKEEVLKEKINRLLENSITPIYCVGESLNERENNMAFEVVEKQLREGLLHLSSAGFSNVIVAYEPVWAIGTGKTASAEQAQEIHQFIRKLIADNYSVEIADSTTILYGGSVKPDNASELFSQSDIDGGLIGGASLNFESFQGIINA